MIAMPALLVILSFAGCLRKSGAAVVVLEKEYIAVREVPPSPIAEQSASVSAPSPGPNELASEEKPGELAEEEIVVGTCVMKKDMRGTSRDLRAMRAEQWIVVVRMIEDLRRFNVHTDQPHFDNVKVGARIKVSDRQCKCTGTVWGAEID